MKKRYPLGVSLVELITAMLVLGIIAVMSSGLISEALQAYRIGTEANADAAQAQLALERITRDLREIRSARPGGDLTPAAAQINFVNVAARPLQFWLSNTSIVRYDLSSGVQVALADSVSALAFSYLQSDGHTVVSPLASPLVFYIGVGFTVTSASASRFFKDTIRPAVFSPSIAISP